jgi:hypothetical protein
VDDRRNWAGAAGHGKSFRYLPDRTVLYPCAWTRVAMVSVSFIRYVEEFPTTPVRDEYRPVNSAARDGPHIGTSMAALTQSIQLASRRARRPR